jgi:N-methylhydantoinase A
MPGPACYVLGGLEPTITDVLLVLGLIDDQGFLGGKMPLNRAFAEKAIDEYVASPLGLNVVDAANIIYCIASEKMADAIRLVTVRKGDDPRKYTLIGAGGAFGLFAATMMDTLHMKEVLFPFVGPVFCAWGMLGAPRQADYTKSFFMEKRNWDPVLLNETIESLKKSGERELTRLGVPLEQQAFRLTLEMRYVGQHHEISVPWQNAFAYENREAVEAAFHHAHQQLFEYQEPDKDWEIINLHMACVEKGKENPFYIGKRSFQNMGNQKVAGEPFGETGELDVPIYHDQADENSMSESIVGPALIHFDYTSVLIPKGFVSRQVLDGVLSLKRVEEV